MILFNKVDSSLELYGVISHPAGVSSHGTSSSPPPSLFPLSFPSFPLGFCVGGTGVFVGVKVGVCVAVGVSVKVGVEVFVGVKVGVEVLVGVAVLVNVGVGVRKSPPRFCESARR